MIMHCMILFGSYGIFLIFEDSLVIACVVLVSSSSTDDNYHSWEYWLNKQVCILLILMLLYPIDNYRSGYLGMAGRSSVQGKCVQIYQLLTHTKFNTKLVSNCFWK